MFATVLATTMVVAAEPTSRPALEEGVMDGLVKRLAPDHPRLGFRPRPGEGVRTFEQVRRTYESDAQFRRLFKRTLDTPDTKSSAVMLASKWIVTGKDRYAEKAVALLAKAKIRNTADSGYYSNVWRYALAYDWLYTHPAMTDAIRTHIENAIVKVLEADLADLDGGGPSMWHGRNQYANNCLISVLSLSHHPKREDLLRAFLPHYVSAVRALRFVEAWPEGPSYWICNRAIQYPLAADCVRTAFGTTTVADVDLVETMRTTGYWQLHSLQPDGSFVPYGDAFGGAGLNTWQPWTESIDYYARFTRDPALIAYAAHARQVSVGRAYRPGRFGWGLVLSCEPDLPMPKDYDPEHPLAFIQRHVPTARLFGRKSTGFAFFRSSWTDSDATHVSFKAGDLFAHHGHYNQGTFTIFKRSALAPITGAYRGYYSAHRLGYYIQTVGVNSLLILAPGEFSTYLRKHKYPVDALSGGQRVVQATGSYSRSVEHWLTDRSPGRRYESGNVTACRSVPGDYDYIAADITAAYNSTSHAEPGNKAKVSHVSRRLVFLHKPDAVVIFDRVVSTDKSYRKRWLLHAQSRPRTAPAKLVQGHPHNGILETPGRHLVTTVGEGRLIHQVLLPDPARVYLIGGPDYAFYAELDGDGSAFTGRNLALDGGRKPRASQGLWRVEVEPAALRKDDVFLNVLWPRTADDPDTPSAETVKTNGAAVAVRVGNDIVCFPRRAGRLVTGLTVTLPKGAKRLLLFGLTPNRPYLARPMSAVAVDSGPEGVVVWKAPRGLAGDIAVNVARE